MTKEEFIHAAHTIICPGSIVSLKESMPYARDNKRRYYADIYSEDSDGRWSTKTIVGGFGKEVLSREELVNKTYEDAMNSLFRFKAYHYSKYVEAHKLTEKLVK